MPFTAWQHAYDGRSCKEGCANTLVCLCASRLQLTLIAVLASGQSLPVSTGPVGP